MPKTTGVSLKSPNTKWVVDADELFVSAGFSQNSMGLHKSLGFFKFSHG